MFTFKRLPHRSTLVLPRLTDSVYGLSDSSFSPGSQALVQDMHAHLQSRHGVQATQLSLG